MAHQHINPDTLYDAGQFGFTHAVKSSAGTTLYCSGQVGFDTSARIVGADLARQADQAFENIRAVLADQGMGPEHVVMLRTYVANYNVSMLPIVSAAIAGFFGDTPPCAQTLLGVQSLALPDLLIEVEVVAVLPD